MNRRESRYRYREQARQPRLVNQELRDRCWTAATSGVELAGHEFIALMLVVDAHAREAVVTKADIDLAHGILGRLNSNG